MPVLFGDVLEYTSAVSGSAGGAITGTTITSGVKNNVVPDITDASRIAGGTDYRKTFWKNNNGSVAVNVPILWTPVAPTNMTLSIGLGVSDSNDADPNQGNMTAWSTAAKVALISDTVGDVRIATIFGMDNSGTPVPTTETVTLTGTTEVLSVATYSKVWAVFLSAIDAAKGVTVKQGTGGTTRGTIPLNKLVCWLWVATPTSLAAGIALPNLAAGQSYGVWRKLVWIAGATAVRPDTQTVSMSENA